MPGRIKSIYVLKRIKKMNYTSASASIIGSTHQKLYYNNQDAYDFYQDKNIIVGVVDTIAELIEDHKISSPALLVFGNVVSVHPAFARIRDFYATMAEA